MQGRKEWVRTIALLMVFTLLLGNISFGAIGRDSIQWNRHQSEPRATNSNAGSDSDYSRGTSSNLSVNGNVGTNSNVLYALEASLTDQEGRELESPVDPTMGFILRFDFKLNEKAKKGDEAYISLPSEVKFTFEEDWILYIHNEDICDHTQFSNKEGFDLNNPEYADCEILFNVTYKKSADGHGFLLRCMEDINDYGEVTAYFWVSGQFDVEIIGGGDEQRKLLFGESEYEIEIIFEYEPEPPEISIAKAVDGAVKFDSERNLYVINWKVTVDIDVTAVEELEVYDVLPKGITYIDDSTRIEYNSGEVGSEDGWTTEYKQEENTIYWTFKAEESVEAIIGTVIFSFSSTVDSFAEATSNNGVYQFRNNAYVKVDEEIKRAYADATVRMVVLQKEQVLNGAINAENRTISWRVSINPDKWKVTNKTLTLVDEVQNFLTIKTETIKLYKVGEPDDYFDWTAIQAAGGRYDKPENISDIEVRNNDIGSMLVIPLGELLADQGGLTDNWLLTYDTEVDDEFFREYNGSITLTNFAYLFIKDGIIPYPLPDVNKGVYTTSDLLRKTVTTSIQDTDVVGAPPTALWEIIVNNNKNDYRGESVKIVDEITPYDFKFNEVIEIIRDSFTIEEYKEDGWQEISQDEYVLKIGDSESEWPNNWSLYFENGIGPYPIRITFKSKISDISHLAKSYTSTGVRYIYSRNTAALYISGEKKADIECLAAFNCNALSKTNSYNYTTQEISWTVNANTNGLRLHDDTVITDTLPYGLQIIDNKINIVDASGRSMSDYLQQEIEINWTQDDRGRDVQYFKIIFSELDKRAVITFKTEFTQEFMKDTIFENAGNIVFLNHVRLVNEKAEIDIEAESSCTIKNILIEKKGKVESGTTDSIKWTVDINPRGWDAWQSEVMDGLEIVDDNMNRNLVLATDTVRLYKARILSNGSLEKEPDGGIVLSPENVLYIKNDEAHSFTFKFPSGQPSDRAYILEFVTDALQSGTYTNKIEMYGIIQGESETRVTGVIVDTSGGGATGSKRGALLEVKKLDAANDDLTLKGAVFELEDYLGYKTKKETDEEGIAEFSNLQIGLTYYLREISAPRGYSIGIQEHPAYDDEQKAIVITVESSETITIEARNTRITGELEIRKVGEETADGKKYPLAGVEFILVRADDNLPPNFTEDMTYPIGPTDEEGYASLDDIEYGRYRLYETKAPAGFAIDEEEYLNNFITTVTINQQNQLITLNNIVNKRLTGALRITKWGEPDSEGNYPALPGVEFKLSRIDDLADQGFTKEYYLKTDESGIAHLAGIDFGRYEIYEMKTVTGYVLPKEALTDIYGNRLIIDIKGMPEELIEITFYNDVIRNDVLVMKTSSTGTTRLQGAEFQLYQLSDLNGTFEEVKLRYDNLVTDENGELFFEGLGYGEYYLLETKAPAGYRLPASAETHFAVREEDAFIQLRITNARRNTGGGGGGDGGEYTSTLPGPGPTEESLELVIIDPVGIPLDILLPDDDTELPGIPKTGDGAPILMLTILLAGAGVTIAYTFNKKKRKK